MRIALLALVSSGCVTALQVTTAPSVADGETAPGFTLPAHDGTQVALASAVAHGPVVLVFYRGYW